MRGRLGRTRRSRLVAGLLAVGLVGVAGTIAVTSVTPEPATADSVDSRSVDTKARKPNIVFVLTDDLSRNLVPHMSAVRGMKRKGTMFTNHFVADGLCCPSRANILTGKYPHNTRVLVNESNRKIPGGYRAFVKHGNQKRTYAVALRNAGYRTGFMGKYLNGYNIRDNAVPRGWDEWHVSGNGYTNMGGSYRITKVLNRGGGKHIRKPNVYITDLLGLRGKAFINRSLAKNKPFFLQLNSFAPHQRIDGEKPLFPPALRDRPDANDNGDCGTKPNGERYKCGNLHVRRTGDFGDPGYDKLDRDLRNRVRMVQSLNEQIRKLRAHLREKGQLDNTYFVFSSDNGYHLGEHGLFRGKGTAYDHDTRMPLVVTGPGVVKGRKVGKVTQTVDFYATFQQMAGLNPKPSNGHGLLGLMKGRQLDQWRHAALFEHKAQQKNGERTADPDLDGDRASARRDGFVPSFHPYNAIRTKNWLFVKYLDGSRIGELYDLRKDAGQNNNVRKGHPKKVDYLRGWLRAYTKCGTDKPGAKTCWKAAHAPRT